MKKGTLKESADHTAADMPLRQCIAKISRKKAKGRSRCEKVRDFADLRGTGLRVSLGGNEDGSLDAQKGGRR